MIEPVLEDRDSLRAALLILLGEGRIGLKALVPRLEPDLWEDPAVAEGLRQLLVGSDRARIAICLQDGANLRSGTARLLDLSERLPSRCELRVAAREHAGLPEAYILVDDRHYLRQTAPGQRLWASHAHPPNEAGRLAAQFTEVWEHAAPHPDLRRMTI
jgi:hypothetical protein